MSLLTLTRALYPGIDPSEVGSIARRGYGEPEDVRIPCIVSGGASYLTAALSVTATSFAVKDGTRFPAAPFTAQVGGELMTIGAISGNDLSSITRAINGTTAYPHSAGRTVYEVRTEYVYQISDQPVKAVGAVYIDGVKQDPATYTAYTGQAGSQHDDWGASAVVAFTVDSFVGAQRNLADAGTEVVAVDPTLCTDDGLGTTIALLGGTLAQTLTAGSGAGTFWCSWPAGVGTIVKDHVTISFSEAAAGAVPARLRISSRNTATGATIKTEIIYLDANASARSFVFDLGTVWPVQLTIFCETGSATINTITRSTTRTAQAAEEPVETITDTPLLKSDERIGASVADAGATLYAGLAWATYDETDRGTVTGQIATGSLYSAAGAVVYLLGVNGTALASREQITVPAGGISGTLGTIAGGGWGTHLVVVVESGTVALAYLNRVTTVLAANASGASGMTSARATIGDRVTVDASWHYDTDGTYGGAGNLIERPDWAIKHFLRNYMSAATGEIDATSFSAAGTLFAAAITGGYKFAFVIPKGDGWATIKQMSFCSRSTTRFLGGKYYLNYTPDAAPASVATLTRDDLAGQGARYVYVKDSVRSVFNDLTALYKPNYSGDSSREVSSGYLATTAASDAASIAKYGTYPTTYPLPCIKLAAMAVHVLAHQLFETKVPLLAVSFPAFWHHGNRQPGETITITDDLYSGRDWWIESIRRVDKFSAAFVAREWPT